VSLAVGPPEGSPRIGTTGGDPLKVVPWREYPISGPQRRSPGAGPMDRVPRKRSFRSCPPEGVQKGGPTEGFAWGSRCGGHLEEVDSVPQRGFQGRDHLKVTKSGIQTGGVPSMGSPTGIPLEGVSQRGVPRGGGIVTPGHSQAGQWPALTMASLHDVQPVPCLAQHMPRSANVQPRP
jgi:hypothetical protein